MITTSNVDNFSSQVTGLIGTTVRDLMTKSHVSSRARVAVSQSLLKVAEGFDAEEEAERHRGEAVAFRDFIRHGKRGMNPQNLARLSESRDLFTGGAYVGSSVGFLVPVSFKSEVESAARDHSPLLRLASIIDSEDGRILSWPQDDDSSISGELIAESSQATEQGVEGLTQSNLGAYIFSSRLIKMSFALLQDQSIDMPGYLARQLGIRVARVVNQFCSTGLGASASQPLGFLTAAQSGGIAQGASVNDGISGPNTIGTNDVATLEQSVDPAYRINGTLMCHPNVLAAMRNVKDRQGAPVFPGLHGGKKATIFGYTVETNPFMDQIPTFPSSPPVPYKVLAFGDFSKLAIRRVRPSLLRLRERFIDTGTIAFLMLWRHDSALVDAGSGAIKYLEIFY